MESKKRKTKPEKQCTVNELDNILTISTGGMTMMPSRNMDEVYPGVFIGDEGSAKHIEQLQKHKINHVLNTAKGNKDFFHVNTNPAIYTKANIDYLAIEATDMMSCNLTKYFEKTSNFIDNALQSGGKVIVHCREGFSRSATIVLAFLMIKHHMTVQEATRQVREHREIGPNEGFLQQLCDLNEELWIKGHFIKESDNKLDSSSEQPIGGDHDVI